MWLSFIHTNTHTHTHTHLFDQYWGQEYSHRGMGLPGLPKISHDSS